MTYVAKYNSFNYNNQVSLSLCKHLSFQKIHSKPCSRLFHLLQDQIEFICFFFDIWSNLFAGIILIRILDIRSVQSLGSILTSLFCHPIYCAVLHSSCTFLACFLSNTSYRFDPHGKDAAQLMLRNVLLRAIMVVQRGGKKSSPVVLNKRTKKIPTSKNLVDLRNHG